MAKQSSNLLHSWKRMLMVAVLLLVPCAITYVWSYVTLRDRGIRQAEAYDLGDFLYTDADKTFETKDLRTHRKLTTFFWPANKIDVELFDGESPVGGICFTLNFASGDLSME